MDEPDFADFEVGVIGASGRMGRWLVDYLRGRGCQVLAAASHDAQAEARLAARCQVLVLAVPVGQMAPVLATLGPLTRPDGLVIDLCSLKEKPLAAMLAHARGEVIGCHPLFGPSAPDLRDQTVFLCPGRGQRWLALVRGFLAAHGALVVEQSAQEHDRLMAVVQSLRHIMIAAFGAALAETGFDLPAALPMAGPWFGRLAQTLANQCAQPAQLYAQLALHNPAAGPAVEALQRALAAMATALNAGDEPALLSAMAPAWRATGADH